MATVQGSRLLLPPLPPLPPLPALVVVLLVLLLPLPRRGHWRWRWHWCSAGAGAGASGTAGGAAEPPRAVLSEGPRPAQFQDPLQVAVPACLQPRVHELLPRSPLALLCCGRCFFARLRSSSSSEPLRHLPRSWPARWITHSGGRGSRAAAQEDELFFSSSFSSFSCCCCCCCCCCCSCSC